jgi:hypothetical protein
VTAFNEVGESAPGGPDTATPSEGGSGPEPFFDDFDRADQLLSDSPNWEVLTTDLEIVSAQARCTASAFNVVRLVGANREYVDNFYVEAVVAQLGSGAGTQIVYIGSASGDPGTFSGRGFGHLASGTSRRATWSNGSLGTSNSVVVTHTEPYTVRVEFSDGQARHYLNSTLVDTWTVASPAGRPCIDAYAGGLANVRIESFASGPLP